MTSHKMTDVQGEGRLDADLRELRQGLLGLRAPAADENALRDAFRAQRRVQRAAGDAMRPRPRHAFALATAATVVIAVATVALIGLDRFDRSETVQGPLPPAESEAVAAIGAFQPLLYAPGFSPTGSYSVVRIRIPLSALAMAHAVDVDGMIEADVLLGEDGLARGIRFDAEDTLLVSTVSR